MMLLKMELILENMIFFNKMGNKIVLYRNINAINVAMLFILIYPVLLMEMQI